MQHLRPQVDLRPFGDRRCNFPLKGGKGKDKMKCEVEHSKAMIGLDWIGILDYS
jgi:hypothetical protein